MKPRGFLLAIIATLTAGTTVAAQDLAPASERVPMIGGDGPDLDACGGIGRVATYEGNLDVHVYPGDYARKKASLPPSTLVWLCEGGDEWQGIVFPSGEFQDLGDCRVSSPIAQPRPYAGPCQHGWVSARKLQLVAG